MRIGTRLSPHGGGLLCCRTSLGIIDAPSAEMGVISTYHDALMGFCLSVKRRVFAQPLVSLTGHSQDTDTSTLTGHTYRTLTGHSKDTYRSHLQDTPTRTHSKDTYRDTYSTHLYIHLRVHGHTHTHVIPLRVFVANSEKTARLASIIFALQPTRQHRTRNKSALSCLLFMRLQKQNAFLFKKSLAMGCLVYIVETIERHNADEKQITHTNTMKTYVTATFADNTVIRTEMNATPQEAKTYYYKKVFNIGKGENDNMQRCVSVFVSPEPHYN